MALRVGSASAANAESRLCISNNLYKHALTVKRALHSPLRFSVPLCDTPSLCHNRPHLPSTCAYHPTMRTPRYRRLLPLVLLPLALAGCGTNSTSPTTPPVTAPDLSGNWQIQSGGTGSAPPQLGVALFGALASQGSDVTGTFRFFDLASTVSCGFPAATVITVSGSIDATRNLTLTSQPFLNGSVITVHLLIPSVPGEFALGTIEVAGTTCSFPSGPAIGVDVSSSTGTFAGTLEPGPPANPGTSGGGPAVLALTQAASPQADGQFPVTGTLNFTLGSCVSNTMLTGLASGIEITLQTAPASPLVSPTVRVVAAQNLPNTSLNAEEVLFSPAPCSSSPSVLNFSGALTRQ